MAEVPWFTVFTSKPVVEGMPVKMVGLMQSGGLAEDLAKASECGEKGI